MANYDAGGFSADSASKVKHMRHYITQERVNSETNVAIILYIYKCDVNTA